MPVTNEIAIFLEPEIKKTRNLLILQREHWSDEQEPVKTTLTRLYEQERLLRLSYGM